eukprot:CAMPEP_0168378210 /NCGR_PEP_ID=MMETSP0228-20121227/11222_1 /TAXON_ID=133427 /ORGANISM="Protoceratium reticulatum, Strain CCCM 535 (=CCMP 1889)" /LENGTH=521 /DNA_ID=CAMNT_0008391227 /DNA_START=44 /DNA_END=1609 /DNA_ORIENTATION=-
MEVLRSRSIPALLILVAAAPPVVSIRDSEFDLHEAHRAQAATNTSVGDIEWKKLAPEIGGGQQAYGGDFVPLGYLGKVSSSYAWKATTLMSLGQGMMTTGMPKSLDCVIKVPCMEDWPADNSGPRTSQLFLRTREPESKNMLDDQAQESDTHVRWRRSQVLISWAENDCDKAQTLHHHGHAVVQCLYSSSRDDASKKTTMFNVFQEYVPAGLAWNDFVPGKTAKQIGQAFYSIMHSSLTAVRDLHNGGMIHHFLTLDSIALQFDHPQQDGDLWNVSVKLTNFELTTQNTQNEIQMFEEGLESSTWDFYTGSPPEEMKDHFLHPAEYDVFMLGCAFLHLLTGSAPQDVLFMIMQIQYSEFPQALKGWERFFFDKEGEYKSEDGQGWSSAYIREAFHKFVQFHSTTANRPNNNNKQGTSINLPEFSSLFPQALYNPVHAWFTQNPEKFTEQNFYATVKPFFAPVLDNVRNAIKDSLNQHPGFMGCVLDIIATMISHVPGDRMSAESILTNKMSTLQEFAKDIK